MFQPIIQVVINTMQRVTALRYIPGLTVAHIDDPKSKDVWVLNPEPRFSDNNQIVVPIFPPEADQSTVKDYDPLRKLPLILQIYMRVQVPYSSRNDFETTMVTLACVHALTFTDGALATFMQQEHSLPPPPKASSPANPTAFEWGKYKLDTLNILQVGPIPSPAGMEIQIRFDGHMWLYPATEPVPTLIEEIRAPAEPPPPAPEIGRGLDEIVRVIKEG